MFFTLASEGEDFKVLEGVLKQKPNQWEITEKFAAIWLADAQKILMTLGDYSSYTPEDMDRILSKKMAEFLDQQ